MPLNWNKPLPHFPTRLVPRAQPLLLALGLALTGCDDASETARESACMRYCEKLDLCDERTDRAGCVQRCSEDRVRSDAYFAARATCVQRQSCNVWRGEVDVMGVDVCDAPAPACKLQDCASDAIAGAPRGDLVRGFCATVAAKLNACDGRLDPVNVETHCLALAPTLSRGYLDAMEACVELPCERVPSCVDGVLDRFNTDLTFTPDMSVPR